MRRDGDKQLVKDDNSDDGNTSDDVSSDGIKTIMMVK